MNAPLILGSGPAGIAVALCCREIGLSPLVVDSAADGHGQALGGMIVRSRWPAIWTPWADDQSGEEIGRGLADRFRRSGIPHRVDEALSLDYARHRVALRHGGETPYEALVIATGAAFRRSDAPGASEAEAAGWLLQRPPLLPEPASPPGGTVLIVGGGNNAFSTAVTEAKEGHAGRVIIAVRGTHPKVRAQILEEAAAQPNIVLRTGWEVAEFLPDHAIRFNTPDGERIERCNLAYANLGYVPRSALRRRAGPPHRGRVYRGRFLPPHLGPRCLGRRGSRRPEGPVGPHRHGACPGRGRGDLGGIDEKGGDGASPREDEEEVASLVAS